MPQSNNPPLPADKVLEQIDVFGRTHVGKVRKVNEDHFFIASLHKSMHVRHTSLGEVFSLDQIRQSGAYLFVIADGVGGVEGGELASGTAVGALVEHISQTVGCYYNFDVDAEQEFIDQLQLAVERTHERVQQQFASRPRGPASTLTMVTLIWPRAYIIHIGDSRAYYLRKQQLRQLTRDQTMGEAMLDEGVMTEEQVERAGLDHILTSAVGAEISPSIGLVDLEWGDVLLLCTDGLTKHLSDDQVTQVLLQHASAKTLSQQLVDAALEGGGSDNISVIVARMVAP